MFLVSNTSLGSDVCGMFKHTGTLSLIPSLSRPPFSPSFPLSLKRTASVSHKHMHTHTQNAHSAGPRPISHKHTISLSHTYTTSVYQCVDDSSLIWPRRNEGSCRYKPDNLSSDELMRGSWELWPQTHRNVGNSHSQDTVNSIQLYLVSSVVTLKIYLDMFALLRERVLRLMQSQILI